VAYSAFLHEGPEPDGHHEPLLAANIDRDMAILEQHNIKWIRTYATDLNGSLIPSIAKDHGIDTVVGTWVNAGPDGVDFWRSEMDRVEEVFRNDDRLVPIIILGNELVYSKKQPMDTIMQMIREAHDKGFYVAMADIPPSYLDPDYAALWESADILLVHSHPFFSHIRNTRGVRVNGTRLMPDAAGADDVLQATMKIKETFPKQIVVVGESGYPSEDDSEEYGVAHCRWCTPQNQKHFLESLLWLADRAKLGVFPFEAFDERWKGEVGEEAGSGPHWGFWDADRVPKPAADVLTKWASAASLGTEFPPPTKSCAFIVAQAECIPRANVDLLRLGDIIDWACGPGLVDCGELETNPLLSTCPLEAKASWAMTKHYQQEHWKDSACHFEGLVIPQFSEKDAKASLKAKAAFERMPALRPEEALGYEEEDDAQERGGRGRSVFLVLLLLLGVGVWEHSTKTLRGLLRKSEYMDLDMA
jgi:exo-beta-1,3-glucanase (GH17 family)